MQLIFQHQKGSCMDDLFSRLKILCHLQLMNEPHTVLDYKRLNIMKYGLFILKHLHNLSTTFIVKQNNQNKTPII